MSSFTEVLAGELASGRLIQPSSSSEVIKLNRAARRNALLTPDARVAAKIRGQLSNLGHQLNQTGEKWTDLVKEYGGNLTQIAYAGEPVMPQLLDVQRRLNTFLERAQFMNVNHPFTDPSYLNQYDKVDIFSWKAGDLSLLDVEQMELPLSQDDIVRVNKMLGFSTWNLFAGGSVRSLKKQGFSEEQAIREAIFTLAVQKAARPEETDIPQRIVPIYDRLKGYFDYYTSLLTDFSLEPDDDCSLVLVLSKTMPWLTQILGAYIPGRLGLTPASAINLFYERAHHSAIIFGSWGNDSRRGLIASLSKGAREAIRPKALPTDLQRYVYFDLSSNKKSAQAILSFADNASLEDSSWTNIYESSQQLIGKLPTLREALQKDIRAAVGKRLEYSMPEGHVVKKVILTSQYRQTLMFILQLGESHLTVEYATNTPEGIDTENHLYGWPVEITRDNPYAINLVMQDILDTLFKATIRTEPVVVQTGKVTRPLEREDYVPTPKEKNGRRVLPKVLTPIQQYLQDSTPPSHRERNERQFRVFYSRKLVTEKMGKKIREKDIDRVMEAINMAERGLREMKLIGASQGKRYVIREGDYRILLDPLGHSVMRLDSIGDREFIYTDFGDHKV